MSATSDYEADVHRRGWVFLPQLPATTPMGMGAAGVAGARSAWSPTGSRYELAPDAVQREQGKVASQLAADLSDVDHPYQAAARETAKTIGDLMTRLAERTGLDHGASGLLAKAIGVPPWFLLVIVGIVAWAVAQQYGLVPSFKKVIT